MGVFCGSSPKMWDALRETRVPWTGVVQSVPPAISVHPTARSPPGTASANAVSPAADLHVVSAITEILAEGFQPRPPAPLRRGEIPPLAAQLRSFAWAERFSINYRTGPVTTALYFVGRFYLGGVPVFFRFRLPPEVHLVSGLTFVTPILRRDPRRRTRSTAPVRSSGNQRGRCSSYTYPLQPGRPQPPHEAAPRRWVLPGAQ